jgi:hypothetical protein
MSEAAQAWPAVETASDKYYIVENKTARSLKIAASPASGKQAALILPPFGARRVPQTQYGDFDFRRWEDLGLIEAAPEPEKETRPALTASESKVYVTLAVILVGVGVVGVFLPGLMAQLSVLPEIRNWLLRLFPLFALCIIAAPLVLAAIYLTRRRDWFRQGGGALALGLVALSVVAVAAVGPVLTMMSFRAETINTTGRMMQIIFIVIAALLPALLYFLYDRQKVSIVSKAFYREIVRFDPTIHTSADAEQKYGHLINEVYGDKSAGYYLANVGLPIMLSSVLIALGWLLILLPINPGGLADFFTLVAPQPSALSFGFLGAYFFALNMVFRRYVRSDLTPKAYSHITVRLLVTTILVWAVSVLPSLQSNPPSPVLLIMAFCIGVVPETATKVIQEFMRKTIGRFSESLDERDPLTNLEGIDLYDRARLSEEGVTNIENLVYHNLIDLLVQTRIPARRLADMVDQAILYLHLRGSAPLGQQAKGKGDKDTEPITALEYLRSYGVRTATDLVHVWRTPDEAGTSNFKQVLRDQSGDFANRIDVIVHTLEDADWMPQLLYRRAQVTQLREKIVTDPELFFEEETLHVAKPAAAAIETLPAALSEGADQIVTSTPLHNASVTATVPVQT